MIATLRVLLTNPKTSVIYLNFRLNSVVVCMNDARDVWTIKGVAQDAGREGRRGAFIKTQQSLTVM